MLLLFITRGIRSHMKFVLQPRQLLPLILAGWINRQQQDVVGYLRTENRVLREMLGKKRILLNDYQLRRLAIRGMPGADDLLRGEIAAKRRG